MEVTELLFKLPKSKKRSVDTALQDETRSFLAALQKDLINVKGEVIDVIELSDMSDKDIYKKYQYCLWGNLSGLVRRYLKKRYKLVYPTEGSPAPFGYRLITDSYIGQTFEKYNLQNKPDIKKSLYDFSQSQLSEMLEAMVEVLNKKKETECQNAAV